MSDAIIPAQKHRVSLELRYLACFGESSTRMGDLLGSPRVASLFSFVRLSFLLFYFIQVASKLSSKERNNSIIFLFLKILFVFL
jgi:hypothetical protein